MLAFVDHSEAQISLIGWFNSCHSHWVYIHWVRLLPHLMKLICFCTGTHYSPLSCDSFYTKLKWHSLYNFTCNNACYVRSRVLQSSCVRAEVTDSTVDYPPVRAGIAEMQRICNRIPLDWWSPLFSACFISLLFASNSKATSQCNFPVYGWSFASLISALELNYKKQLQPYSVFACGSFNVLPWEVVNLVLVSYTNCASIMRDRNEEVS